MSDPILLSFLLFAVLAVGALGGAMVMANRLRRRTTEMERQHIGTVERLQGDLTRLRGLMEEYIAQREGTEQALRMNEDRFRALVDALPLVVFQADLDSKWVFLSEGWERITGWPVATSIGASIFENVPVDQRAGCEALLHSTFAGATTPFRCLLQVQAPDASDRWLEMIPSPLRENGAITGCTGTLSDVTSRVLAERALRQSEERYRALIERAAYGIFRSRPDGAFLDVNPSLVEMLGYSSADDLLALDPVQDLYAQPGHFERWTAVVESGGGADWFDLAWKRRDGSRMIVRLSARAAHDAQGRTLHYEGIVEDVTERQRRETIVRRAERMASLGHTLAGVAHELNNPLAAISGFAQILLRGPLIPENRSPLETIHREAHRAARIVKDLLTFARRQEARAHHRMDVNEVVRYIADAQRYAMETHGVSCVLDLTDAPAVILGDQAQFEQVVLNLLVNARQAVESRIAAETAENGKRADRPYSVTLRSRIVNDRITLEFIDTGPGMASSLLPRIWDPFFTTKEEGEGTGLGLSVVHGIVGGHGGSIDVESTEGVGTMFTIALPRLMRTDTPPELHRETLPMLGATARAERPMDLLVVDDETAITRLLERFFAPRGHAVMSANSGEAALRLAAQSGADAVICDLRMPGMDGVELIRRLQALPAFSRTRFVLSTGDSASPSVRESIEKLGLAAVVDKPYDLEALRHIVEER
ncbi:MAG TPA: PAS domain S-box protein [Gemmatimonadaceae bacterium]|nr:PAS domain S-box protein [Gemmatimonadaceae bacterium]